MKNNTEILLTVQDYIAELYENCKDLHGFEPEGENWDIIMASLISLETVIFRLEEGKDKRFNYDRTKGLIQDVRDRLKLEINSRHN